LETIRVEMVVAVAMSLDATEWAAAVLVVLVVASGNSRAGDEEQLVWHVRGAQSIPALLLW
jgi:hypothetical protein